MNVLTFSIFLLNKGGFATSTLAPLLYCNRVATCCCRPAIKVRSCSSQVGGEDCGIRATGYCCCCQDMFGSGDNDNDDNDDSLYKDKQFFSSELIASY